MKTPKLGIPVFKRIPKEIKVKQQPNLTEAFAGREQEYFRLTGKWINDEVATCTGNPLLQQ